MNITSVREKRFNFYISHTQCLNQIIYLTRNEIRTAIFRKCKI